jgi:hypothetical protein
MRLREENVSYRQAVLVHTGFYPKYSTDPQLPTHLSASLVLYSETSIRIIRYIGRAVDESFGGYSHFPIARPLSTTKLAQPFLGFTQWQCFCKIGKSTSP